MNLRQIELLRAVVRCETTVRAAQELGLSQPAVSNAIKHLESQVGFPLFERINNRLFPTAEARALYKDSEPIFALHAAFEARVQDIKENRAGHIRIIATPPLGYGVLPSALRNYLAKRPKVRVSFDIRRFEHVLESVENGTAELGFVMGMDDDRGLDAETFFTGNMVCVMRPDHPLAAKPTITPEDLRAVSYIALEQGTRMGTIVRKAFAQADVPFRFSVEVRYCNTACVLAESGVGVAVVDPLSPVFSGHYDLAIRPFSPASLVTASAVRSRKRPISRAADAFLREVRLVAAETAAKLGDG
ncbi:MULTISPECIES: LysR family transcriptional regulator [unclassified Bosea (in: a-proteobacteria)]|uniref:LysR family transcriptional regulator n=1 Tax=unclassified Bosea (in: a-proteobacteria) TaxID=2653178 RepID=UPI000F7620EC|nr:MULTISPECIES: LysR family transcriptional regulator [unclassified Bosea (in: a-proteobacteria)]AZO77023.1 transcriptional regulator [Bosea sp. Tri-49]RXT21869.1 transcriptional regulator [Bosea sp. Tri-39]RXT32208.1 transcriptional regulator [Bosea sp. Tri-54]